uniref:NADH-ubiquinone oxidoreductase chain 3 n=1 Tax=Synergus sp. 1 DYB-20230501 TaxID=3136278 RepID=A0AAU6QCI6_9HYME
MFYLMFINLIIIMLSFIILNLNFILSKKKMKYRNKLTSFECGFDNISFMRMPFSINFFMISIIFLIFDIEISLIFPVSKYLYKLFYIKNIFITIMIILLLDFIMMKSGVFKWLT